MAYSKESSCRAPANIHCYMYSNSCVIFNTIIHSWELALFFFFKWCAAGWPESKKNGRVEVAQKSNAKSRNFYTISGQKQIQ